MPPLTPAPATTYPAANITKPQSQFSSHISSASNQMDMGWNFMPPPPPYFLYTQQPNHPNAQQQVAAPLAPQPSFLSSLPQQVLPPLNSPDKPVKAPNTSSAKRMANNRGSEDELENKKAEKIRRLNR
jgi:hypothetical protein